MPNTVEDAFDRFFKAGSLDRRSSMPLVEEKGEQYRVAICHHTKNHRISAPDEKTIDFTMALHNGVFCYAEIKQHWLGAQQELSWSAVSEHQQQMLDYAIEHGCAAVLGLGWVDDEDKIDSLFLLPWQAARKMQRECYREFKTSDALTPWATVTPDRIREWAPRYELMPVKLRPNTRSKKVGWFTQQETSAHSLGWRRPNVPNYLPAPMPLEWYINNDAAIPRYLRQL